MGTAGLVFGVIAVAWVVYLAPSLLSRRNDSGFNKIESDQRFSESMRIIRRSSKPFLDEDDPYLEISTPCTRRAAMEEVRTAYHTAANRRFRGTVALVIAIVVVLIGSFFVPQLQWWSALVPVGMLIPWFALCRFNTKTLTASLDEKVRQLREGWTEETVAIELPGVQESLEVSGADGMSVELGGPVSDMAGSLWDSIPVTPATYVSGPQAARTVRTIDLGAPVPEEYAMPPTADDSHRIEVDPMAESTGAEAEAV